MSAGSQGWFHGHRMDPTCGSFQSQRSETTLEFRLLNSLKKKKTLKKMTQVGWKMWNVVHYMCFKYSKQKKGSK